MNIEDIKAREEKYLFILRRWALGLARMLLMTAALVLILGVGLYGWASFVSSQHFNLPSQAEMVASVDPCSYLTNADAGTNGRDREGVVPVRKVLGRCNASQIPIPKFEHVEDALGAYALDIVAMQTSRNSSALEKTASNKV